MVEFGEFERWGILIEIYCDTLSENKLWLWWNVLDKRDCIYLAHKVETMGWGLRIRSIWR